MLGGRAWAWGLLLLAANAWGSGPRWVTGPPYYTLSQGDPMVWQQNQLLYFTDPGDLSSAVNHAVADALVANAMAVWNVPQARITLSQGGGLAEHVSGQNVYLDANGIEWPADVMVGNASAIPIAIVYDTDGSVTDTLLGAGASGPSSCRTNSVTENVDSFTPAGYIAHAEIVLNGRCTGMAAAQQLEMQYKLERAIGRVLGLAWSQANDNVFTGVPTPTYNQALHWPIMHPIDIICGAYSYQCLPMPFTLRPDDVASMVRLYGIGQNATVPAGKQVSLTAANMAQGTITFPDGSGMAGVNVLVRRGVFASSDIDAWYEASAVTGDGTRRAGTSPFVAASVDAFGSMGSVNPYFPGLYTIAYLPLQPGLPFNDLIATTEAVNPLYIGSYSIGPYGAGMVAPSGTNAAQTTYIVSPGSGAAFDFLPAGSAQQCGTGTDGSAAVPAAMPATGWWNATLCGYHHASYLAVNVRAGRSFTLEATALDANGLATTTKAMPVIGVYGPNDDRNGVPQMGVTPAAFQGNAVGTTALTVQTGQVQQVTVAVADQRGDGRPDFLYQGRMFYADSLGPAVLASGGGTVTITGTGFRTGNAVTVNGVAAAVTSWTPTTIVAVVPAMTAVGASSGTALDVQVLDHGTGATSTMYGALTYQGTGPLAHAMVLVSAPSGNVPVGTVAASAFAVRVLLADGVTPVAGDSVIFQMGGGAATFGVCGAANCAVKTDATGLAQTTVTPGAVGPVTVQAGDGSVLQSATFTGQTRAGSMIVLSAPSGTLPGGQSAATAFAVQVLGTDGVSGLPGHSVMFAVTQGSATFDACDAASCAATTNGNGQVSLSVTPGAAGPVTLQATDAGVSTQVSFTSGGNADTMKLLTAALTHVAVNANAGDFTVQLLQADGVTPDTRKQVTLSAPAGVVFSTCGTSSCAFSTDYAGRAGSQVRVSNAGTFTVQATYGTLLQSATIVVTVPTQTLTVVSAPSMGSPVGMLTAMPFAVRMLDFDGVTPVAGTTVTLSATPGAVTLGACGGPTCNISTDGNGVASTTVLPLTAGTISIDAAALPLLASVSFTAVSPVEQMVVVTQPGGTVFVGDATTFAVRLVQPDGVTPDAGKTVTFSVTNGGFSNAVCGIAACSVLTDASGVASITGVATGAGSVVLKAVYAGLVQTVSFTAATHPDVLKVLSVPASGGYTGAVNGTAFAVQAVLWDGVTPAVGRSVTVSVTNGSASLGACGGVSSCVLQTDGAGMVSTAVTALAPGSVGLAAVDAGVIVTASFTVVDKPDTLVLSSAPADGAWVGSAAAIPFGLRVLKADGVTADPGKTVVLTVSAGSASLGGCVGSCSVVSDANGNVSVLVTPLSAGSITLNGTLGNVMQSVSFTAVIRADVVQVLSAPANGALVGDVAGVPFAVQVLLGDGVTPGAGKSVTMSVTNGSATLAACGASSCVLTADARGRVSSGVVPGSAGVIGLMAADGNVTVAVTFTAAAKPDALVLVSAPSDGAFVGSVAATLFAVRVVKADGVTPDGGQTVAVAVGAGSAALAGSLVSNANGLVSLGVTPLAEGEVALTATLGSAVASASFVAVDRPDTMQVLSVPADGALVGDVAAAVFAVKVLAGDGSAGAGRIVTLSITNGSGILISCGKPVCTLATDGNGVAQSGVEPTAAGRVGLMAADGTLTGVGSFKAVAKPDTLQVVSAPANGALVGDVAGTAFSIEVLAGDGSAAAGRSVMLTVTKGAAVFSACGAAVCAVVTDANGMAQSRVQPSAAGVVGLLAADGAVTGAGSFLAVAKPDVLSVSVGPPGTAYVGDVVSVTVRLVLADGVTPAVGKNVAFTVGQGSVSAGGCGSACVAVTDAQGYATTSFSAAAAGLVGIGAVESGPGSNAVVMSFTAMAKPDVLTLVSGPTGQGYVGDVMGTALAVKVTAGDGSAGVGRSVVLQVTQGSAVLGACGGPICVVTTDGAGMASTTVMATGAGVIGLSASGGGSVVTDQFTAVAKADLLVLLNVPGASVHPGAVAAGTFAVKVLLADGVSPVAGVAVTFAMAGRGSGTVVFGLCGGAKCVGVSGVDGMVSTTVTGGAVGSVMLVATADASAGGASVSAALQVIADVDSVTAEEAGTYVAEGSQVATTLHAVLISNGAAVNGAAVTWSGAGVSGVGSSSDAAGIAAEAVMLGPVAAGGSAPVTACAWTNVCATFGVFGVGSPALQATVASGGAQGVTGGAAPGPVSVQVTDGAGHAVAGASVTVYQTVTALGVGCPAQGRCPAQPVLGSATSVVVSDVEGMVVVSPLVVDGTSTQTEMAFAVGTGGFATAVVSRRY